MKKIVSVVCIVAATTLLSSCTFGKTTTQAPVDTKAPVVEVDTTTTGALSNPEFVKEIENVVNTSLEQAVNSSSGTAASAPVASTGSTTPLNMNVEGTSTASGSVASGSVIESPKVGE